MHFFLMAGLGRNKPNRVISRKVYQQLTKIFTIVNQFLVIFYTRDRWFS
jgi:hypothetical protein